MKVAIYARVSTLDQHPEAQLEQLREYAARRGFEVHREYVDRVTGDLGQPAKRLNRDRAYRDLMAAAGKKEFGCVLVWKYDRLARSLSGLVEALQTFSALSIDFISMTQAIDTTTPMGRFFFHLVASFAEFERELIVERTRAGLAHARAKGVCLGRPRVPGVEARILALRERGLGIREIARIVKRSPSGVLLVIRRAADRQEVSQ